MPRKEKAGTVSDQMGQIKSYVKQDREKQEKAAPGYLLNPFEAKKNLSAGVLKGEVPEDILLEGRWVKPHPNDDEIKLRNEVLKSDPYGTGKAQYTYTHDDPIFQYAKDKKMQEAYLHKQAFMSYLFDPKNPEYNAVVHQRFPGLKNEVEKFHEDQEVIKAAYWALYDKGHIENDEDLNWAIKLMSPEFQIPMFNERERAVLKIALKFSDFDMSGQFSARKKGLFSPRVFGRPDEFSASLADLASSLEVDETGQLKQSKTSGGWVAVGTSGSAKIALDKISSAGYEQIILKMLLALRILPALRGKQPYQVAEELKHIFGKLSSVDPAKDEIKNSYASVGGSALPFFT